MAEFKERLKYIMDKKGVKAIDLARNSGMTRGAISQYLAGKVTPKVDKLNDLAKALLVNPVWLMGYDVDMITGKELPDGGLQSDYWGSLFSQGFSACNQRTEEIKAAVMFVMNGTCLVDGKVCPVPEKDLQAVRRHINLIIEDMKKQGITEKHITANAEEEAK